MDIKRVDLIQQLVDKHGYTKKAATSIVDDFTDIILYNLGNGDTVSIHNFGCFDILERKALQLSEPADWRKGQCTCALDSPVLPRQQNALGCQAVGR